MTIFKTQGKKICEDETEQGGILMHHRFHFIIAWVLYSIGGLLNIAKGFSLYFANSTNKGYLERFIENSVRTLPYEMFYMAGAISLLTVLNSHAILSNCEVFDEHIHEKSLLRFYRLYASLIAFSFSCALGKTTIDTLTKLSSNMGSTLMQALF